MNFRQRRTLVHTKPAARGNQKRDTTTAHRHRSPYFNHSIALVNSCNIGVLTLNEDASQVDCALLCSDGNHISFSEANTLLKTQTRVAANKSPAKVEREQ
jgi:hypothetical protein